LSFVDARLRELINAWSTFPDDVQEAFVNAVRDFDREREVPLPRGINPGPPAMPAE
jgi:hypothetical protein